MFDCKIGIVGQFNTVYSHIIIYSQLCMFNVRYLRGRFRRFYGNEHPSDLAAADADSLAMAISMELGTRGLTIILLLSRKRLKVMCKIAAARKEKQILKAKEEDSHLKSETINQLEPDGKRRRDGVQAACHNSHKDYPRHPHHSGLEDGP